MSGGSGGDPGEAELARHWRRIGRMAQHEEPMRALRDSVLAQMPDEFRNSASGINGALLDSAGAMATAIGTTGAASSSAAAVAAAASPSASALPVTSFLRALCATRFARTFFRKRVRELREQFCLPTHDESAQSQPTPIDGGHAALSNDGHSSTAAASSALLAECAHVDVASLTLLASCHEKLGELRIARALFDAATKARTDTSSGGWSSCAASGRPSSASSDCHAQWTIEVERLTRQLDMDERRANRAAQVHPALLSGPPPAPFDVGDLPPPRRVDRVHHTHLSHARFIDHYVHRRVPVVIEGLSADMFAAMPNEPRTSSSSLAAAASNESAAQSQPQSSAAAAASATPSSRPWSFTSLQSHLHHLTAVPLKYSNRHSTSWAKLEEGGTKTMTDILDEMQQQRRREVEQQRRARAAGTRTPPASDDSSASVSASAPASSPSPPIPSYYVHDYSLCQFAPQLLHGGLTIPHYFCGDEFQLLRSGSAYRDTWPSLFVGARGSRSDLHVDSLSTHFWMAMCGDADDECDGGARKRWVIYDPADLPLLYPSYSSFQSIEPSFDVVPYEAQFEPQVHREPAAAVAGTATDSFFARQHARFPLLRLARPRVVVLRPGDVLFVPAGSPHFVENLDTTLSISANFLLEDNRDSFARDCATMAALPAHAQMRDVSEQMRQQQQAPDALAQRRTLRVEMQQACLRKMEAHTPAAAAATAHAPLGHAPSQAWPRHLPFSVFKLDDADRSVAGSHEAQQSARHCPARASQKRTATGAMVASVAGESELSVTREQAATTTLKNPPPSDSVITAASASGSRISLSLPIATAHTVADAAGELEKEESKENEASRAKRTRRGDTVTRCADLNVGPG